MISSVRDRAPRAGVGGDGRLVALAAVTAVVSGALSVVGGLLVFATLGIVGLFVACAYRPVFAPYVYLVTLPFLAGIERGALVPMARPNEALLAVLLAGACFGGVLRYLRGDAVPLRLGPMDMPLAALVLLSTVWPIASMMLRGQTPLSSDLVAVLPMCKLAALLVLVRMTVRTEAQLLRCARLIVWPGALVAVVAILQTLNVGPVLDLLAGWWSTDSGGLSSRGTTTLGSSIATGDYVIMCLSLVICCSLRGLFGRREALVAGFVLGAGVLAAGQFSTWIAAAVAVVAILRRTPQLRRRAVRFLPVVVVAVLIGAPAFLGRMSDFAEGFTVPRSWLGRWDNITHFYVPRLDEFGFVLGVSPDSVLAAPETWRELIYLESGYLQFLWVGGLPLLVAFGWLSVSVLTATSRLRTRPDATGAYAAALEITWWVILVLSVIDIHLVLRGAGDLLFVLLAVVSGRWTHDRS